MKIFDKRCYDYLPLKDWNGPKETWLENRYKAVLLAANANGLYLNDPFYKDRDLVLHYLPEVCEYQNDTETAALIERVNSVNPDVVIDVGCGRNHLKKKIMSSFLYGFDPIPFENIDYMSTIFQADLPFGVADVVLCLGSINFGSTGDIIGNLYRVMNWLKPSGLIEMRARIPHVFSSKNPSNNMSFWRSPLDVKNFTKSGILPLKIHREPYVYKRQGREGERMVWTWKKN